MKKSELITLCAERTGLPRTQAARVLDTALAAMAETLGRGESVQLMGFGTLEPRLRPAHTARNPKTAAPVAVPPKPTVFFRPGTGLREAMEALSCD